MPPTSDNLPLDPSPFVALFFFGVVVALIGRLYQSRLLLAVGLLAIAAAAISFPVMQYAAAQ